jgi:hypothetical protein
MLVEGRGNAVNILIRLGCDPVDLRAAIEADADRVRDDAVFATVTGLPMDAGRNVLLTEAAESIMKAAAGMPGRSGESPVREENESPADLPEAIPNRRSMPVDYRGRRPATDDLLSAMLSDGENAAARALAERGITYERVRREIEAMRS